MAASASPITWKQILSDARMLVRGQGVNFVDPTNESMLIKGKIALSDIYQKLNGAKVSRFYGHSPIGTPADYLAFLGSANHTYTSSTKTISEASGTAITIDSTWIGALVMFGNTTGPAVYFGTILTVTTDTSFILDAERVGGNIAAGSLWWIALKPPSSLSSISIDGYRIDQIRRLHSTTAGNIARVNADTYEGISNNPNYNNSVVAEQSGASSAATLRFTAGSSVTNSGGWPIAFYDESPRLADDVDEYVDLPDEYHGALIEEIARLTLLEIGAEKSPALESALLGIEKYSDSFQAIKDGIRKSDDSIR